MNVVETSELIESVHFEFFHFISQLSQKFWVKFRGINIGDE